MAPSRDICAYWRVRTGSPSDEPTQLMVAIAPDSVGPSSRLKRRYSDHVMRSIAALGTLPLLALLVTSTSCGSGTAPAGSLGAPGGSVAPQGSLTLSGAITATVTAGTQDTRAACRVVKSPPLPPATTPIDVSLTGEVDFGSGSTRVVLSFLGAPTTLTLPLPGELKVPGPPGLVGISANGTAAWSAGQSSPTSSGTLTLSVIGGGRIHGSVDASLAPLRGSSAQLHIAGSWNC